MGLCKRETVAVYSNSNYSDIDFPSSKHRSWMSMEICRLVFIAIGVVQIDIDGVLKGWSKIVCRHLRSIDFKNMDIICKSLRNI